MVDLTFLIFSSAIIYDFSLHSYILGLAGHPNHTTNIITLPLKPAFPFTNLLTQDGDYLTRQIRGLTEWAEKKQRWQKDALIPVISCQCLCFEFVFLFISPGLVLCFPCLPAA
ncbi:hypothetical protein ILYODFUR_024749 [Ilyodon furcidens]|uniref:Uncharacterized protein n=1 Tax=Ilyodon furcidens TaxID=33524 RepID=A0ABV0U866_9TELE